MADQAAPPAAEPAEEVDAEIVEDGRPPDPGPGTAVATAPAAADLSVAGKIDPAELVKRLDRIKETAEKAMVVDVDYGKIPGTDKPTLLKPGAEKLGVLFELDIQPRNEKRWEEGGHLTVSCHATVYHAPTGTRLGYGEGMCTTREKKYGRRKQDRTCPDCGEATIKKSKYPPRDAPDSPPGWYCYEKIGGCGKEFAEADPAIVDQVIGEVDNPHIADTWNTVIKMAQKRARVDAVLAVTGASALFTQDMDEAVVAEGKEGEDAPAPAADGKLYGEEAGPTLKAKVLPATAFLLAHGDGPDKEAALRVLGSLKGRSGGYYPRVACVALVLAAAELKSLDPQLAEQAREAAEGEQAAERQQAAEQGDTPAPESVDTPTPDEAYPGIVGPDDDIPF